MKKIVALFFSIAMVFSFTHSTYAQEKSKMQVASVKQDGETVKFSLASSQQFIVGGNIYVLHIGDKKFDLSEQSTVGGKENLTFLIPANDYGSLKEGTDMYLTYGHGSMNAGQMKQMSTASHFPCWTLGEFNKNLLSK